MTYSELQTYVHTTLLNRPELAGGSTVRAIQAAHLSIQRDPIVDLSVRPPERLTPEWDAMDWISGEITWAAGATEKDYSDILPSASGTIKRIVEVILIDSSDNEYPMQPDTASAHHNRRLFERQEFKNAAVPSGMYHVRWHISGRKLRLLFPPAATDTALSLKIRAFRQLPFYATDESSDFFSDQLWDLLGHKAAWYLSLQVGEDAQAQYFLQFYNQQAALALREDMANRDGGQMTCYRPPLPIGRKY